MFNAEQLEKKWEAVLEHADCTPIKDKYKKAVVARLLENQETALREERAAYNGFLSEASTNTITDNVPGMGAVGQHYDPVLISLVRRAMPNIIAYDIAGVQPMTQPTGLIFAMKSTYKTDSLDVDGVSADEEALHFGYGNDRQNVGPDTAFSGKYNTDQAEALSGPRSGNTVGGFGEMGFSIERTSVVAKSRALRATYTMELAQDLKAVHGLDAESELANILSTEILAEINREIVNGVNTSAVQGGIGGAFDLAVNSDGRWSVEKYKGLILQIEREANKIALDTRRGKGNFMLVSSNVASAIAAAGMLDYTPAIANLAGMDSDPAGSLFAGTLNGRIKVFIDPYTADEYVTVGYRGTNPYDAGVFYCPYVPLTMMRAVGENDFQPRIGFKTRYGMRANPFVAVDGPDSEFGLAGTNFYFRRFTVSNLIGQFADPYPYT